ncbi:MAG: nucleotidyl transferase AbiEii/AbiGii toxin family protein [Candidatus Omnitrophota bacterium]
MLNLEDVLQKYPERLRGFKENILTEYLQYKTLDIIYKSKYADKLIFIGGTAIRIVYQGARFSQDLDFDNQGLSQEDFGKVAEIILRELELDGYQVEIKNVFKGAYHCYIRFPGILYQHGMSGHKQQRILIQIDAEPQHYEKEKTKFLINKFGLFRYINTVSPSLLLSQKIAACLERKREQGRDFFDVVFLMSAAQPDYGYLKMKLDISTKAQMIAALRKRVSGINMEALARDVEPFLFDPAQKERVVLFNDWLDTI